MKDILKEINRALDDYLLEGKKIRGFNFPLASIRDLERVIEDLKTTGKAETINNTVHEFCMYCGLKTQTKGIGWEIFKHPSIGRI